MGTSLGTVRVCPGVSKMFCLAIILIISGCIAADWNYDDTTNWSGVCQTGLSQSPINLVPHSAIPASFPNFRFNNYDQDRWLQIENNGHSINVRTRTNVIVPTLSGGGLDGNYILDGFHFHWGSEHTVNGERFPLEVHLVHYSAKYNNVSQAAQHRGGLAVLGVLFQYRILPYFPLIELLGRIPMGPNSKVDLLLPVSINNFLPGDKNSYIRYDGSLTTPDCNEGVIWTVFRQTLPVSMSQIQKFASVFSERGRLTHNFRPVQNLNGRSVHMIG